MTLHNATPAVFSLRVFQPAAGVPSAAMSSSCRSIRRSSRKAASATLGCVKHCGNGFSTTIEIGDLAA